MRSTKSSELTRNLLVPFTVISVALLNFGSLCAVLPCSIHNFSQIRRIAHEIVPCYKDLSHLNCTA